MNDPFDLYTLNVCGDGNGDIPSWLALAIGALPFVLLVIDAIGG